MKPYYEDEAVTIYHGDCRDVLPAINANCLVTDPPWMASSSSLIMNRPGDIYGVHKVHRVSRGVSYGDIGTLSLELLRLAISRISSDVLIHCGYMELGEICRLFDKVRNVFVWHDTAPSPRPGFIKRRDVSFIVWGGKNTSVVNGWDTCLFSMPKLQAGCMATERLLNRDGTTAHPAQEPIKLYKEIIKPLDGTILDPYMGTGTTLRAAKDLGRKAIGIEISEAYCEIAARRMQQSVLPMEFEHVEQRKSYSQSSMFDAVAFTANGD